MKNLNKTPLIAAIAASFVAGSVSAETNPFAMNEMSQGYMQVAGVVPAEKASDSGAAKKTEGACGEAKCGAMMKDGKMKEGMEQTCGAMMKGKEGACGAMGDAKPAADAKPAGDAKAGEMACGAAMPGMKSGDAGMKSKDMEAACGAKMSPSK
ncbi:MAG: hypothetical protein ABL903_06045 [Methylococcales bacterium]